MLKKIENSIPSKQFVLICKGWATPLETKQIVEGLYQEILFLVVELKQHCLRRKVALIHKRVKSMGTKRVKKTKCSNSQFYHSGRRQVG